MAPAIPPESAQSALFAQARFTQSVADPARLPPPDLPEVAFAGRSNAGKSSALNRLTGQKSLARVSKTPGRTRLLNFFELGPPDAPRARLVDLPGYGYAQVPPEVRRQWAGMIEAYLRRRQNLRGVVLIMDVRHPLTDFDRQMLAWTGAIGLTCHVLLTKADKLSRGAAQNQLLGLRRELAGSGVSAQLFSAQTGAGCEEAQARVLGWIETAA